MQIHEVTLRQKTDEGILDKAKAGYNALDQGVRNFEKNPVAALKGGLAGAKAGYQKSKQDRETAAQNKAVAAQLPQVAAKAEKVWNQYAQQAAEGMVNPKEKQEFLNQTPGGSYENVLRAFVKKNFLKGKDYKNLTNINEIESLIKDMAQTKPAPNAQQWQKLAKNTMGSVAADLAPDAEQTATQNVQYKQTAGTPVAYGSRLKLAMPPTGGQTQPSYYYKYNNGSWTNELGQQVDSNSVAGLEAKVNKTTAKFEPDPNAIQQAQPTRRKGKQK